VTKRGREFILCPERVEKSTRFWAGMPLARKSRIFGLRSIPANTTPVSLKNRLFSCFSLTRCFSVAQAWEKQKMRRYRRKNKFFDLLTDWGQGIYSLP